MSLSFSPPLRGNYKAFVTLTIENKSLFRRKNKACKSAVSKKKKW